MMSWDWIAAVANHLWQSTLFAAIIGLVLLTLKSNRAQVRYSLWLIASVKFLIPFSLLVAVGTHLGWSIAPVAHPATFFVEEIRGPVLQQVFPSRTGLVAAPSAWCWTPTVLLVLWFCGFIAVAFTWWVRWRRLRALVCQALPLALQTEVPVLSSPVMLEPGVFGIFRPVLLLPKGITDRLAPAHLQAIIAHELCHVRRRDNLAAATHLLVEAIFWFHPLVWWIGDRLVEERERACDEEVLRLGNEPHIYAESILQTCQYYLESPLACLSGVTGADLKKRVARIMAQEMRKNLGLGKKLLLTGAGFAAVTLPLVFGLFNGAVPSRAQSQSDSAASLSFEVASVKPNQASERPALDFLPGGRFVARNIFLQMIIATAYNLPFQSPQLSGGPDWIRSERYDIEAAAEKGAIPPGTPAKVRDEKIRLMLQALLADRFKLKMRRETKEVPVYALTIGKKGPDLQRANVEEKDCADMSPSGDGVPCHVIRGGQGQGIHGRAVTISDVASFVSNFSDRPVIDKTGLPGLFFIQTEGWVPLRPRPGPPPGAEPSKEDLTFSDPMRPTLFMIFERLGLKLESQKGPVALYVIEHVERPSEN